MVSPHENQWVLRSFELLMSIEEIRILRAPCER